MEVGSIKTMEPQGARENPGDIGEEVGGEDVNLPLLAWNFLLQSKNCAGFTIFNSWNRLFSSRHHKFQPPHCADEEIQAQGLAEVTPQVVK